MCSIIGKEPRFKSWPDNFLAHNLRLLSTPTPPLLPQLSMPVVSQLLTGKHSDLSQHMIKSNNLWREQWKETGVTPEEQGISSAGSLTSENGNWKRRQTDGQDHWAIARWGRRRDGNKSGSVTSASVATVNFWTFLPRAAQGNEKQLCSIF